MNVKPYPIDNILETNEVSAQNENIGMYAYLESWRSAVLLAEGRGGCGGICSTLFGLISLV